MRAGLHSVFGPTIMTNPDPHLYGLLAEFTTPEALVAASKRAYEEGYRRLDAYSPFPVEDLAESIGFTHNRMPAIVLRVYHGSG